MTMNRIFDLLTLFALIGLATSLVTRSTQAARLFSALSELYNSALRTAMGR